MSLRRIFALVAVLFLVGLAALACRPDFPDCDTDEHCAESEEGQETGQLYCVNGQCVQCRDSGDCDAGYECRQNECQPIPNYCESDADCTGTQVCRDNRCEPECQADDDCDGDLVCIGNECVEEEEDDDDCTVDADCGPGQVCEHGECVAESACTLETVNFPFDSSRLSQQARQTLQANADCIQERNLTVQIEGHCDERGTTEYNLALGERRANAVRDYLTSLGVPSGQIQTTSYGDQQLVQHCGATGPESCHEQNRRAEFNIR